eukprot:768655-Hanusia_phi.AAC.2
MHTTGAFAPGFLGRCLQRSYNTRYLYFVVWLKSTGGFKESHIGVGGVGNYLKKVGVGNEFQGGPRQTWVALRLVVDIEG